MPSTISLHGQRQGSLSPKLGLAYILPVVTTALLVGPMAIVQGVYAKYFGMPLTTIATILLIARLFDAVTDPIIGLYSDRYHAHTGSRKIFVMCGGVSLIVCSYFLYVPVNLDTLQTLNANAIPVTVSASYFLWWFIAFYLAWTIFEIPHLAWASELANTSKEKNLIYSLRTAATWFGVLLFYLVPLLPMFETNEFTPRSLSLATLFAGSFMLLLLFINIKFTPNGVVKAAAKTDFYRHSKIVAIKSLGKEIGKNKPVLLFLTALTFSFIAVPGMWFTLIFIYVDTYLQLGNQFAQASLVAIVVGFLMIGVWYWLANRLGKKTTLALGQLFGAIGALLTGLLTPGESGFLSLLLIMVLCYGVGGTVIAALGPSLLADIIDYGRWKFRSDRAATYFSLYTMISKISVAIGGAIGLAIAGSYGFDPAAKIYAAENIAGLRLAIAWIPTIVALCTIPLFLINPLTAHRHALIRNRLDARDLRVETLTKSEHLSDSNNNYI